MAESVYNVGELKYVDALMVADKLQQTHDIDNQETAQSLFALVQAAQTGEFDDFEADLEAANEFLSDHPQSVRVAKARNAGRLTVSSIAIECHYKDSLHAQVRIKTDEPGGFPEFVRPNPEHRVQVLASAIPNGEEIIAQLEQAS